MPVGSGTAQPWLSHQSSAAFDAKAVLEDLHSNLEIATPPNIPLLQDSHGNGISAQPAPQGLGPGTLHCCSQNNPGPSLQVQPR